MEKSIAYYELIKPLKRILSKIDPYYQLLLYLFFRFFGLFIVC